MNILAAFLIFTSLGILVWHFLSSAKFKKSLTQAIRDLQKARDDIAGHKKAEEALAASERMLRAITSSLAEGIYVLNRAGNIIFMNPEAEHLLGWTADELSGKNVHELIHIGEEDNLSLPAEQCGMLNVIKTGTPFSSTKELFRRKDGTSFPISIVSSPIFSDGKIIAAVAAFRDISTRRKIEQERERLFLELEKVNRLLEQEIAERRSAEEKITSLNEDLEMRITERTVQLESINSKLQDEIALHERMEKKLREEIALRQEKERMLFQQSRMAAMGEMIGAIAHQWRQPLNVIGLIVQNLKMAYDYGELDSERFKNAVASAMWQIKFMSKTIDDFRNFFKPSKDREIFDTRKALDETLSLVKAQLQNNYISIEIIAEKDGLTINGYPNEFKHVLLNLINNAKDAILLRQSKEECRAKITFEISGAGDKTIIKVRDTGGGIPDAIIDRIFDPYFTTKEEGTGTGIGLYISKTMIERNMGGRLTAGNCEDGAEFIIEV